MKALRVVFFFLISLWIGVSVYSQEYTTKPHAFDYTKNDAYDSVPRETTHLPDPEIDEKFQKISRRYSSLEFEYNENNANKIARSSFWKRVSAWFRDFFRSLDPSWSGDVYQLIYYVLLFLGAVTVIYVIFRLIINRKAPRRREKIEEDGELRYVEKNLLSIAIDEYIEQAIRDKKWNLAIRYLHLKNLQLLAKKGIIEWDYRKTNQEIILEIQDERIRTAFENNTQLFNYVWFGDFELTESSFQEFQTDFINFKNEIA